MNQLTFTIEDFKSPERLERLFRRLNQVLSTPAPPAVQPDLQALARSLSPLIRSQLQAPGIAPLNLQSLLPTTGLGIVLEDTHANRLTLYPAATTATGTLFWETDRTVLYVVEESSTGARSWQYVGGMFNATFANRPTDLGTDDTGFLYFASVYIHICRWSGSGWAITDGGGGYIVDAIAVPAGVAGWQLCDGTATTYLTLSGADLAETAFTTPDENSGVAGVYHKSIAAYTGVINAAVAPVLTGTPATLTGTVGAIAATATAALTSANAAGQNTADNLHTHPAPSLTMNPYTPAGTIGATAEPRNMGVLKYFRR